jgi:hypothetical protein
MAAGNNEGHGGKLRLESRQTEQHVLKDDDQAMDRAEESRRIRLCTRREAASRATTGRRPPA